MRAPAFPCIENMYAHMYVRTCIADNHVHKHQTHKHTNTQTHKQTHTYTHTHSHSHIHTFELIGTITHIVYSVVVSRRNLNKKHKFIHASY